MNEQTSDSIDMELGMTIRKVEVLARLQLVAKLLVCGSCSTVAILLGTL